MAPTKCSHLLTFESEPDPDIELLCALQVLSKKKLQDLVREIDPNEQLDEDVEEVIYLSPLQVNYFKLNRTGCVNGEEMHLWCLLSSYFGLFSYS